MLSDYDISFESGTIITGAMLEKMCYAPKELAKYLFSDYSDGIISGMDIKISKNGSLTVTAGVYKRGDRLFVMNNDKVISGFKDGKLYALCLETDGCTLKTDDSKYEGVVIHNTEIYLEYQSDITENSIVLCRFKGFPYITGELSDFAKDVFWILNPCQSSYKEPAFHRIIFRAIYNKLKNKRDKHPLDYILMLEISRNGIVPMQMIRDYVAEGGIKCDMKDTNQLFKSFIKQINNLHLKVYSSATASDNTPESLSIQSESIILDD